MTAFELTLTVPADLRFGDTVAALACSAARQAGCDQAASEAFGASVVRALEGCVTAEGRPETIPVVVRSTGREIEVLFTCGLPVRVAQPVPVDV